MDSEKEEYLTFAEDVLKLHESWCMKSEDVHMNRSTMRWWETLWEGDADGPGICAGHAWTLWRAEADFYYGLLKEDGAAFRNSYHAYFTNLIKIRPGGDSYSCYYPDSIPGGGLYERAEEVDQRLKGGYPNTRDHSLSKYLWVRLKDTWWNTCVVLEDEKGAPVVLNGKLVEEQDGVLHIQSTVTEIKRVINLKKDYKVLLKEEED